jgi:hypothetical protein
MRTSGAPFDILASYATLNDRRDYSVYESRIPKQEQPHIILGATKI